MRLLAGLATLVRGPHAPPGTDEAEAHPGGLFARLFRAPPERDGAAHALKADSTGFGNLAQFPAEAASPARAGRRARRPIAKPEQLILEALSGKVLHDWLQNRHQTLYPLTINLRRLESGQADLLLHVAAVSLTAADPVSAARLEQTRQWIGSVGAEPDQIARFEEMGANPPGLSALLDRVQQAGLGAFAYAMSVAAADQRNIVSRLFLDYLAARLAVPANVIRSVNRRFRG